MGPPGAGATKRLLHPAVPAAFFGFAVLAQAVTWALVALTADQLPGYAGGFGPVLAAVHVLTVGVLMMTAAGATLQILPVATLQSPPRPAVAWLLFAPLAGGAVLLPLGFLRFTPALMAAGAGMLAAALALYAVLLGRLVARAPADTVPGSRGFLWAALACLLGFLSLAATLAAIDTGTVAPPAPPLALAAAHLVLAGYGFLGLLAFGVSHVLIPMLALSRPPEDRTARPALALAVVALALAVAGLVTARAPLIVLGAALGFGATLTHLAVMRGVLARRLRRRLPAGFRLIRLGWAMLPVSLVAGGAAAVTTGETASRLGPVFAALLLVGWLWSMVAGILQQILPFLGSMHTARAAGRPATVSALAWRAPLTVHEAAHGIALALLVAGLLLDAPPLVRLAAASGGLGAAAFALFAATVALRTGRHLRAAGAPPQP